MGRQAHSVRILPPDIQPEAAVVQDDLLQTEIPGWIVIPDSVEICFQKPRHAVQDKQPVLIPLGQGPGRPSSPAGGTWGSLFNI